MKKVIAMVCLCAVLLSTTVWAASLFPDMPGNHWAYSAVEKMVNDGRVNGFPDGEFKPDNLVTRWQFAKMAGGNPDEMTDPHRDATRDEAALYLWERAGKPKGVAPGAVTVGSKNHEAVEWAYATGIMQGDNGVNLRLDSTLTRAEAACLIVRAEQELTANVAFEDTVSPVILARVWDSMQTGIAYEPEKTITNGEIARMALLIASGTNSPNYLTLKEQPSFSGAYAKEIQMVCQDCWGIEKASKEFMNQPVTMQDAVAALSFYTMKQASTGLDFSPTASYEDAKATAPMAKLGLSYASHNRIILRTENKIQGEKAATMRELACVLVQLDELIGLNKFYGTENGHSKLQKSDYAWPNNASDYALILENIPVESYDTALMPGIKPVKSYRYAQNMAPILVDFLNRISNTFPKSVDVAWTLYPSLVVKNGSEVVIRAGLKIVSNPEGFTLNQMFASNAFAETYHGDSFLVDITTGKNAGDMIIPIDKYTALRAFAGKE